MNKKNELTNTNEKGLSIFENKKIRKVVYNDEWYFSIIDIIEILTETDRPRKYLDDLKRKIEKEQGDFQLSGKNRTVENVSKRWQNEIN